MSGGSFRSFGNPNSGHPPFDPNRQLEQQAPSLYPPRTLPKILSRQTTRRDFDHVFSHERAINFSGFKTEGGESSEPQYHYRQIIGKQHILAEIDLNAQLTPQSLVQIAPIITKPDTSQPAKEEKIEKPTKRKSAAAATATTESTPNNVIKSPTTNYQITSNNSLVLTGSAMWTFPKEIRTFFFRIADPATSSSKVNPKAPLSLGFAIPSRPTSLGPPKQMHKGVTSHYSTAFDLKKRQLFAQLVSEFSQHTRFNLPCRYEVRMVKPPASAMAKMEAKRKKLAKKMKKLTKGGEDGEDGDETREKTTKRGKKDDDNDDGSGSDGDFDDSEPDNEESEDDDTDFGEVHDDDDDDYGNGASGDDEPTF